MTVPKPVPSWVGFTFSLGGLQESSLSSSPTAMTSKPERTAFYNMTILIKILLQGKNYYYIFGGMELALKTCPETSQMLRAQSIPVYIEETRKAAELYNKLAEHELVGGLFHSTC